MRTAKFVGGVLVSLVTTPIWFYVVYQMLSAIHATDVTWLLFWVYVPALLVVRVITVAAAIETAQEEALKKFESVGARVNRLYGGSEQPARGTAR